MTEAEARAALRAYDAIGGIEPWIAARPWQATPDGWTVAGELQGWRFRLAPVAGGVRGHPLDGMTFGAPGTITHLVDRWVENARREANTMTEAEARAALRAFVGGGEVEPWIAGQPWKAESGGWFVLGELHGSHFHLEVMAGGVRVIASRGGGREPAVWSVPRLPRQ